MIHGRGPLIIIAFSSNSRPRDTPRRQKYSSTRTGHIVCRQKTKDIRQDCGQRKTWPYSNQSHEGYNRNQYRLLKFFMSLCKTRCVKGTGNMIVITRRTQVFSENEYHTQCKAHHITTVRSPDHIIISLQHDDGKLSKVFHSSALCSELIMLCSCLTPTSRKKAK